MERLVQILFGHERAVFTNGQFGFGLRPHPAVIVAGALLFCAFIYFVYVRPRARLRGPKLAALISLRVALFALLVFLLLRPVVVVPSVVPRSTSVALLADDSRSMQIADAPGRRTRLEAVRAALFSAESRFLPRLQEKFRTDLYAFSGELGALGSGGEELFGEGAASDLGGAVSEAARRAAGVPLSAVVLVSDGAANVPRDLGAVLARAAREEPPGLHRGGRERGAPDGRRAGARADAAARARRFERERRGVRAPQRLRPDEGFDRGERGRARGQDGGVLLARRRDRGRPSGADGGDCRRRTATRSRSRRSTAR